MQSYTTINEGNWIYVLYTVQVVKGCSVFPHHVSSTSPLPIGTALQPVGLTSQLSPLIMLTGTPNLGPSPWLAFHYFLSTSNTYIFNILVTKNSSFCY